MNVLFYFKFQLVVDTDLNNNYQFNIHYYQYNNILMNNYLTIRFMNRMKHIHLLFNYINQNCIQLMMYKNMNHYNYLNFILFMTQNNQKHNKNYHYNNLINNQNFEYKSIHQLNYLQNYKNNFYLVKDMNINHSKYYYHYKMNYYIHQIMYKSNHLCNYQLIKFENNLIDKFEKIIGNIMINIQYHYCKQLHLNIQFNRHNLKLWRLHKHNIQIHIHHYNCIDSHLYNYKCQEFIDYSKMIHTFH